MQATNKKNRSTPDTGEMAPETPRVYGPVLRALYEAVFISDLDGRIIEANPRAERSLGWSRDDLVGRAVSDTIAGFTPDVLVGVERNLAAGRFTVLDAFCRRKAGVPFPAEIAIGRCRLDEGDYLVFSVRNMEWRERTLERLRTGYNALHNAAAGLVITDEKASIRYTNPAFSRLWCNPADVDIWIGRDLREVWGDSEAVRTMVDEAVSGRIWNGELEGCRPGDALFYVQATAAPNRAAPDAPAGLVFSFIDISDRKHAEKAIQKEAEEQIRKAREQDDFAGLLNILSLPDVVQLIDASQKSGRLCVFDEDKNERGCVGFVEGQVATAHCGEHRGKEAFYALLKKGGHAFVFQQSFSEERDPTLDESTMGLLIEGSRRIDESASG